MTAVAQRSFSGGEITPSLYARTDIAKYSTSARILRNMMTMRGGGSTNRPGTKFVIETKDSSKASRLIPFIFNADQTYVLEFGDLYMRVHRNGANVTVSGVSAWITATPYVAGDLVSNGGVNYYCFLAHTSGASTEPGTGGSWTTNWHALSGSIFEIPTPYVEADLFTLDFKQSADVITIDHPTYDTRELARTADTGWTLTVASFVPGEPTPTTVSASGTAGSITRIYHVTAIDDETGEESLAGTYTLASVTVPTANDHTVTWDDMSVSEYNVYMEENGVAGFLGVAGTNSYVNSSDTPDTTDTPPTSRNPFSGSDNRPSNGGYFQQRNIHAGSNNAPETVEMSRSSNYNNYTKSTPIQDDDAISFTVAGNRVNRIKHLIVLGKLIIMTSGGEWVAKGNADGVILPGEVNLEEISYYGSADLEPLLIGSTALFLQARSTIVRDLINDSIEGYTSDDLTIFSSHLFDGFTVVDWDYQQIPHSIVWACRSDGALLGFTYIRKQKVFAWHRHDTGASGEFESVVSVPEGTEDAVYFIVKRTINGSTVRYVERMESRLIGDIEDLILMDSALSYDGTHTGSTTMTLSGGTNWTYDETLTLTASAGFFVSGDIGNQIHLTGSDGTIIRFTIEAYSSTTVVTGKPHKTVPSAMQAVAITSWGKAVDSFSGLDHLEGEDVSVFADGFVIASPNNDAYTTITVSSGTITLAKPRVVVHVGIPITADVETLDIDTVDGETLTDKKKLIGKVHAYVEDTRGVFAGGKPPDDDTVDPLEGLYEFKARNAEDAESPVALKTDVIDIKIESEWGQGGRVFIRQVDPVPLTILSIVPSGFIPFRG
ncbi:hypothetical protein KAR91_87415 [Candidatus Pacearchaeota archaeon]|nr:hypothetical protein [Candidatus Pacearchaeota archaeon]